MVMAIEMSSDRIICSTCGKAYSRRKGFFPVSYAELYKGIGYIHMCKTCIDTKYGKYLALCHDSKAAVRQMCRKLDLYWNEKIYDSVAKKSSTRTMMTQYIIRSNSVSSAGKSYDDTLFEEGTLWDFGPKTSTTETPIIDEEFSVEKESSYEPTQEVIAFWGNGYTPDMYEELEQRRAYWMSKYPDANSIDIGTEAIIRQICNLEIDINKDRVAGKPIDKSVNALNNLLGSASLKPTQRKEDLDSSVVNTPMGVWLYRYENERPLPEVNPELKDVNGLKKYIFTWMGHLCKMLDIKGGYTRMYEDEVSRLRVERPEYDDEDDETLLIDSYSEDSGV